jgi:alpha-mannosidase
MYEISGKKTEAKLTLPWPVSVIETDLIERPFKKLEAKGQTISTVIEPFEIKTLKLVVNRR